MQQRCIIDQSKNQERGTVDSCFGWTCWTFSFILVARLNICSSNNRGSHTNAFSILVFHILNKDNYNFNGIFLHQRPLLLATLRSRDSGYKTVPRIKSKWATLQNI